MTLTAGTATYTLDPSLVRIKEMFATPQNSVQLAPMTPVSLEQILQWSTGSGLTQALVGGTTHYALLGLNDLYVFPTPASADVLTVFYVKNPTPLAAASDLPVLPEPYATNALLSGALYQACLFLKDPDAMTYKQDFEKSKMDLRTHLRRKTGAGTVAFRILNNTNWVPHDPSVDIRSTR